MFKVGILGASGRMGLEVAASLTDGFVYGDDTFELADAVSGSKKLTSIEGVPVRTLADSPREKVHVWIDFSTPAASVELANQVDCPIVVCTTGFTKEQKQELDKVGRTNRILFAPNTSPGMNLVLSWLEQLPQADRSPFKVVMREEHHRHKKDSPSGTAKRMLEAISSRGYNEVPIQATRAGGIRGNHEVKLISDTEEIVLEHRVHDRRVFAEGALIAAHYLLHVQSPGVYSMSDVFRSN